MFTNKVYQSFSFPDTFLLLLVFHNTHSYQYPSFPYLVLPRLEFTKGNKLKQVWCTRNLFFINNKYLHSIMIWRSSFRRACFSFPSSCYMMGKSSINTYITPSINPYITPSIPPNSNPTQYLSFQGSIQIIGPSGVHALPLGVAAERSVHYILVRAECVRCPWLLA